MTTLKGEKIYGCTNLFYNYISSFICILKHYCLCMAFLLIMFIVYEIWKYFKLKKIRKQYEEAQTQYSSQSQSSSRNDNPDIIDVEYKVVDEEKTGDDN